MVTPMASEGTPVVLVADDEPSMLALVGQHIKTMGYRVLEASDGEQAWQLAQEHLPDLVILDVMMPGMSGWEVCRKIREDVALAHTAIIMLTGIGENLNELTSPLYGADSYIDKPFAFPELDEKVRGALTKRRGSKPGLARTEPGASEKKNGNGNGGHERNLLSPPERSSSETPETGEVDDAWPQEATGQTNGADESIMLVPTGTRSSIPSRRRKSSRAPAASKRPKAKASAKPSPKTKSKAAANGKAKTKAKAKAKAKPRVVAKAKPSKSKTSAKKAPAKSKSKSRRR
jgi:DNA-binding response OmpR family regulator